MTPGYHHYYRIIDTNFHFRIPTGHFAQSLDHLLSGFRTSKASDDALRYALSQAPDGTLILHHPNGESCAYPNLDNALPEIEIEIIHRAVSNMRPIGLHAGAICWHGKTVLFPGASGCGKTTLALGCALSGAHFLSDEIAVIDPRSGKVRAFPRTLCVKNQSLPLFASLDSDRSLQTPGAIKTIAGAQCLRANVFQIAPPDKWHPVHAIVCPRYTPNVQAKLSQQPKAEAIAQLLKVTMNRHKSPKRNFDALTSLATSTPCFTLQSGELPAAVTQIQTLCRDTL